LGVYAEQGEALTEACWGDRSTGQVSGEQPGAVGRRGEAGVSAGCVEVAAHETGEGIGDFDVAGSEADRQGVAAVMDLVACHHRDAGQLLTVEQHEAARDAIDAGDAGVV